MQSAGQRYASKRGCIYRKVEEVPYSSEEQRVPEAVRQELRDTEEDRKVDLVEVRFEGQYRGSTRRFREEKSDKSRVGYINRGELVREVRRVRNIISSTRDRVRVVGRLQEFDQSRDRYRKSRQSRKERIIVEFRVEQQ